jgi:hypothetical protein
MFMKKILALCLVGIFIASNCYGADINDWKRGDASIPVKGTDSISDADTLISNYIVDPLDKLLTESIHGCTLTYATAATVTIGVGEVTCYNAAKTIKRMRRNTSTVTITLPANGASGDSLDTGNAAVSTWYHVYAVADADATTFTGICSASASAPTGYTYFRYLGSFYNNASDNIALFYWYGYGSDIKIMWDIPISITTTASNNAWSGAISCATAIPSTSTFVIFGIGGARVASGTLKAGIRPHGSTWSTEDADFCRGYDYIGAQRHSVADSSQQINVYTTDCDSAFKVTVEGYCISR